MTVGIDIRSLASGKRSGVEEYIIRLLNTLFENYPNVSFKLFASGMKSAHADYAFDRHDNVKIVHLKIPNKLLNASFLLFKRPHIDVLLGGVDVLFLPNILFAGVSPTTPYVVTIHDLSFEHFSEFLNAKRKLWHRCIRPKRLAEKAANVITVSEASKEDIQNTYGIDAQKVSVVYSGETEKVVVTEGDIRRAKEKYNLPEKFFLCFGTLEPRKNISGIVEAFVHFQKNAPDYSLVIAGSDGWKIGDAYKNALTRVKKGSILFTGFVDEEDKFAVYKAATGFLFLSHFEGFGFPLLEASAVGTPIIASAHSSYFEIIGDGALLVDPSNVNEMKNAMVQLVSSEELRNQLAKKALQKRERFSLKSASEQTYSLFKDLYERSKK